MSCQNLAKQIFLWLSPIFCMISKPKTSINHVSVESLFSFRYLFLSETKFLSNILISEEKNKKKLLAESSWPSRVKVFSRFKVLTRFFHGSGFQCNFFKEPEPCKNLEPWKKHGTRWKNREKTSNSSGPQNFQILQNAAAVLCITHVLFTSFPFYGYFCTSQP